jgi:amino acid transporter
VNIGFTLSLIWLTQHQVLCEIKNPRKNFRRGIIIAVGLLCVLYMLVNLSYVNADTNIVHISARLTNFADGSRQQRATTTI